MHTVGHDRTVSPATAPAADGAARVLVVGDANPDLVLSGDVVPRFGQAEQLLDEAVPRGRRLGRDHRPRPGPARPTRLARRRRGRRPLRRVPHRAARPRPGVDVRHVAVRPDLPTGLTVALNRGDDRAMLTLTGAPRLPHRARPRRRARRAAGRGAAPRARRLAVPAARRSPRSCPAFLGRARARGLTTSLDTNDDPAGRWEGVDALLPHLDVLLPNRAEVVALGRDPDAAPGRSRAGRRAARWPSSRTAPTARSRSRRDGVVDRGRGPARRRRRHHRRRRHLRRRLPRRLARRRTRRRRPRPGRRRRRTQRRLRRRDGRPADPRPADPRPARCRTAAVRRRP